MQHYGSRHWLFATKNLKYLHSTRNTCIIYHFDDAVFLEGTSNNDFAIDREDRQGASGFVSTYAGDAISWHSMKQTAVAQSTLEAVYVAISFAIREVIWLRRLSDD